jgi:uncharacterized membrane protein
MDEATQGLQQFDSQDVEKNKVLAIVGYIFPILFFIPLVTEAKDSIYAKFHANQQLILLIFCSAGGIGLTIITFIFAFIPVLGPIVGMLLLPVFWLACLALMIIGIINAANGARKKLPVIGGIATLIK